MAGLKDGSVVPYRLSEKARPPATQGAADLDFSDLVSPIPRTSSRSRNPVKIANPGKESWSLIEELLQNRSAYNVPTEEGRVHLKLVIPFQEQVRRLCQRVGAGHNGKDPGVQPACFAMIKYALPVIEEWPETKELAESVSRRLALPDSADKEISRQIYRYAEELKLPSAPRETTKERNVILSEEIGNRLLSCARKTELPYHPLAALCVLVALSVQPVGVNCEEREEISKLVKDTKRRMHTAGWCAGALMDKLEAEAKASA